MGWSNPIASLPMEDIECDEREKRVTPLAKAWERCVDLRRAAKQYALVSTLDYCNCLRIFSFRDRVMKQFV